jgi:hypothetical protein
MNAHVFSLGATGDDLDRAVDAFLLKTPKPTSTEIVPFLQVYGAERTEAAQRLIERGVAASAVAGALSWIDTAGKLSGSQIKGALTLTAAAFAAYHGYRRNTSILWGMIWFACGTVFPVFTSAIMVAQGFAEEK